MWSFCVHADAQSHLDSVRNRAFSDFERIRNNAIEQFETIRRNANDDFARIMAMPWKPVQFEQEKKPHSEPTPPPIIEDIDTLKPKPIVEIVIGEVVPLSEPNPQPKPIEPIIEKDYCDEYMSIYLYGTEFIIRKPGLSFNRLGGTTERDFALAWKRLNSDKTNNLILDCLKQRDEKLLCDWAYLRLVKQVAENIIPDDINASTLLTGFVLNQSGYKIRFAQDAKHRLYICYNSTGIVYNTPSLILEGGYYYILNADNNTNSGWTICNFSFPGEKPLSFEIREQMKLAYKPGEPRYVCAHFHPEVNVQLSVNENLIDFFNSYPEATANDNRYSKWALYANTPASPEVERELYPALRDVLMSKTELEAVNILLHLAQSFPYGYDEDIWGCDRVFFMDESWYYPEGDCEDHAINFSRMVRDLLGLDVALIYYPGHLGAAVAFTDSEIQGDYILYENRKYTICDPTIFYSDAGRSMSGMNNAEAVVLPLK